MSDQPLFENIYQLTEQLKGGPLIDSEKEQIQEIFNREKGSALDRAYAAMAEVLSTEPSIIVRRIRSLERMEQADLIAKLEKAAGAIESRQGRES